MGRSASTTLTPQQVLRARLAWQGLTGAPRPGGASGAADCVGHLVTLAAKHGERAIALRSRATAADVRTALDQTLLLQTYVLRPTRQYVRAQDIRWLQEVTGTHVENRLVPAARSLGLDTATIGNSLYAIAHLLADNNSMSAEQMAPRLSSHGLPAQGPQYRAILAIAAIRGLTCYRNGSYELVDDVLPPQPRMDPDEALGLLARRFFTGHGPSSLGDFARWSSLPLSLAQRGCCAVAGELAQFDVEGLPHYGARPLQVPAEDDVILITLDDEAVRPYPELPFPQREPVDPTADGVILLGAEVVGWFTLDGDRITIKLADVTTHERNRIEEHLAAR